ncbi:MAG: pyruvate dehydrogenase (acetyl-transferring) E1 component subunit alpha, partial [Deltaproteobacteria bacterium]
LKGDDTVALVYFGDGATSEGDFHVGLNFAGVFKTPVIFFCRNNGYAISVPTKRQTASKTIAQKAVAYGIEGVTVDGNDLLAVIQKTREAADRARSGGGATLIEAATYRLGAHSSSDDPSVYRDPEEAKAWEGKDPIRRFRRYLEKKGLWNDSLETEHAERCTREILDTIAEVEKIPEPELASLFRDVYHDLPWHLREQQEELLNHRKAQQ